MSEIFRKAIAGFFTEKRKAAGIDVTTAADELGYSIQKFEDLESGRSNLPMSDMARLARHYGISETEVMTFLTREGVELQKRNSKKKG